MWQRPHTKRQHRVWIAQNVPGIGRKIRQLITLLSSIIIICVRVRNFFHSFRVAVLQCNGEQVPAERKKRASHQQLRVTILCNAKLDQRTKQHHPDTRTMV